MRARAAYRCACRVLILLASLVLTGSVDLTRAEHPRIAELRAAEQKNFTDDQIIDGFFKIAFGAELAVAGRADRIRKYERPVRVFVDSRAEPDRSRQVADVVTDIATRIEHLDIAMTDERAASNVGVTLVHKRDFAATIRAFYGRERARRIQRSLEPACLSGFSKDEQYRIVHSDLMLDVDAGDFVFYD